MMLPMLALATMMLPIASGAAITANIQLANLHDDGTLPLPPRTKEILIEIGANSRNTLDQELLPNRTRAFLLTFEPILDKYAALLARNSKADIKSVLGHHHPRGMVFPFAVSPTEGEATFHMDGDMDGCASLLSSGSGRFNAIKCASPYYRRKETRVVPTIRLETVLGKWLAQGTGSGWPISLLKIDAQGFDVSVFESAGPLKDRIRRVSLEMTKDGCQAMYESAPNCSTAVQRMASHGFFSKSSCATAKFKGARGCEDNFLFTPGENSINEADPEWEGLLNDVLLI